MGSALALVGIAFLSSDFAPDAARFRVRRIHLAVLRGAGFPEAQDSTVRRMRISPDRSRIAFVLWHKASETYDHLALIGSDGSGARILVAEGVSDFAWRNDREIAFAVRAGEKGVRWRVVGLDGSIRPIGGTFAPPAPQAVDPAVRAKIARFVEADCPPHEGILGGTVTYGVVKCVPAPDGSKIAFLVRGEDGHALFYPAWYVCDAKGDRIDLIDLHSHDLSEELVWLSVDAVAYIKDGRLWRAEIR